MMSYHISTEQRELIEQHNAAQAIRPSRAERRRQALPLQRRAERDRRIVTRRANPPGFKKQKPPAKGHKWVGSTPPPRRSHA